MLSITTTTASATETITQIDTVESKTSALETEMQEKGETKVAEKHVRVTMNGRSLINTMSASLQCEDQPS